MFQHGSRSSSGIACEAKVGVIRYKSQGAKLFFDYNTRIHVNSVSIMLACTNKKVNN